MKFCMPVLPGTGHTLPRILFIQVPIVQIWNSACQCLPDTGPTWPRNLSIQVPIVQIWNSACQFTWHRSHLAADPFHSLNSFSSSPHFISGGILPPADLEKSSLFYSQINSRDIHWGDNFSPRMPCQWYVRGGGEGKRRMLIGQSVFPLPQLEWHSDVVGSVQYRINTLLIFTFSVEKAKKEMPQLSILFNSSNSEI
jgi:hypothetical protein